MVGDCDVRVRFCPPPTELRGFFTTFYLIDVNVADGGIVRDRLHPEWANLRFHSGNLPHARLEGSRDLVGTAFPVIGPTSRSVDFSIGSTRMWGIGLQPLGWAKFVRAPAARYRNALIDGASDPAFAPFVPLAESLFTAEPDIDGEYKRIAAHFLGRRGEPLADEARIRAVHSALVDPETDSVRALCERSGLAPHTVERLARRCFGFPPSLLLRRQRFLRSLGHFVLDPSLKWIGAMDSQYHDQAQFVRDFREFMGMSPRQYAALDKPILGPIMLERARFAGHAVQALDGPEGSSPPA